MKYMNTLCADINAMWSHLQNKSLATVAIVMQRLHDPTG